MEGRPLWQRQLDTLSAAGPSEVFISGRTDGPYSAARVPIISDQTSGLGPLGGIAAALRHARFEYLLVLAIDLPAMTSDFLAKLVESAMHASRGVVPADAGRYPASTNFRPRCRARAPPRSARAD